MKNHLKDKIVFNQKKNVKVKEKEEIKKNRHSEQHWANTQKWNVYKQIEITHSYWNENQRCENI